MAVGRNNTSNPPDAPDGATQARLPMACSDAPCDQKSAEADAESESCPTPLSEPRERRASERVNVIWQVDCETENTFLYAAITNISQMGIFVQTTQPLAVGTQLKLKFSPPGNVEAFALEGTVQWINEVRPFRDNPNPGMGIKFINLSLDDRERIVEAIHTIAYLRE